MQNVDRLTMLRFASSDSLNLSILKSATDAVPVDTSNVPPNDSLNVAVDVKFLCMVRSSQLVGSVG